MISATQKVSGWSLVASSGKKGGCSGRIPRISSSSRSQLVPSVAETGMSSRNACAPRHASRTGSIRSRGRTRSALLSTQKTGPRYASSGSRTSRSGWARWAASTTRQTRSTSSTARRAVACMKLSSPPVGVWSPGVSTKTICAPARFLMPVIRLRVVWGRGETIASFWPTRRFRSVDLPVFGRPINETNPARVIVAGPARPVPSVGGLRRGATRLRSACPVSFQRGPRGRCHRWVA